jgi:uncharacterized membrane protein (UPF0127 family)
VRGVLVILALTAAALFGGACGGSSRNAVATREPGLALVRIGALAVQAEAPAWGTDVFTRGLGGRESLPDDRGMLFVFPQPGRFTFWMKDMLIPIDMIWISDRGQVVDIHTAEPEPGVPDQQLKRYTPNGEAKYVLEVRAGLAADKGVQVGDEAQIELP